jgi:hypothetical protein
LILDFVITTMGKRLGSSGVRWIGPAAIVTVGLALMILSPVVSADLPGVVKYRGIHPLFPHNGAFCYIDVTHVHRKRPTDLRVYRVLPDDEHLFVGDPVSLGYVGPTRAYFGPHPLAFSGLPVSPQIYCYLRGPHFHAQEAQPSTSFVAKNDVYWFMGTFPPEFERDRHYLWINDTWAIGGYRPPKVALADAPNGYRLPAVAEAHVAGPPPSSPLAGKAEAKTGRPGMKRGTGNTPRLNPTMGTR